MIRYELVKSLMIREKRVMIMISVEEKEGSERHERKGKTSKLFSF